MCLHDGLAFWRSERNYGLDYEKIEPGAHVKVAWVSLVSDTVYVAGSFFVAGRMV